MAIKKANAIDRTKYTEDSLKAMDAAAKAVERDKKVAEQAAVDQMAKEIEDAIAGLQEKVKTYVVQVNGEEKANVQFVGQLIVPEEYTLDETGLLWTGKM